MPVAPQRRALEAIVADVLAPLLAAPRAPGKWALESWDYEQGICVTVSKGGSWLLVELERRDEERPCSHRTRWFNVCARRQFGEAGPLDREEERVVEQLVALVRAREARLPLAAPRPEPPRGSEVREILVDRMLVSQGPGHYYLNAYAGCMIGCAFCYVADRADLSRAMDGRAALPWGRWVDVKVNAADVLREEVARLAPGIVRMSPILTDPYQPLEKRYRITRQCLEVLLEAGFTPVILTRGARIIEDVELLSRFPRAAVGLSIPTDDDAVRAAFEPGADSIEDRIAALAAAHRAGLQTMAVIQPMLPMSPERLAGLLAPIAKVIRIDRMHEMERVRPLYEAAGCPEAATDAFFVETERALRAAFAARGVRCDPLEDLAPLFE